MISKELLSEVLNQNVTSVYKQQEQYRYTTSNTNGALVSWSDVPLPNIYELAHKCKEWALNKGYIIEIGVHPTIKKDRSDRDYFYKITTDRGQRFISNFVEIIKTEPEAIFKACEYILKENNNATN